MYYKIVRTNKIALKIHKRRPSEGSTHSPKSCLFIYFSIHLLLDLLPLVFANVTLTGGIF